jgi:hypothetical protein
LKPLTLAALAVAGILLGLFLVLPSLNGTTAIPWWKPYPDGTVAWADPAIGITWSGTESWRSSVQVITKPIADFALEGHPATGIEADTEAASGAPTVKVVLERVQITISSVSTGQVVYAWSTEGTSIGASMDRASTFTVHPAPAFFAVNDQYLLKLSFWGHVETSNDPNANRADEAGQVSGFTVAV